MDFEQFDGREPWLGALDTAADARDRLRVACTVDRRGPQARLARHDLAAAFDALAAGLAKYSGGRHDPA